MTTKQTQIADQIFNELDRLGVSTNQDSYSGLMCDYMSVLKEGEADVTVVEIYDDSFCGFYDGQQVLNFIQSVESVSLCPDDSENIWNLICEFEV